MSLNTELHTALLHCCYLSPPSQLRLGRDGTDVTPFNSESVPTGTCPSLDIMMESQTGLQEFEVIPLG